jgi:hypothetical protein
MSALGQKQTYAAHQPIPALPLKATAKADMPQTLMSALLLSCSLPLYSVTASVNWSLTGGNSYWLLQTTFNNGWRTNLTPSFVLPSNTDIAILFAGTFAQSIASAVTGGAGRGVPNCIDQICLGRFQQHHDGSSECSAAPGSVSAFRHRPRCIRSACMEKEAEGCVANI